MHGCLRVLAEFVTCVASAGNASAGFADLVVPMLAMLRHEMAIRGWCREGKVRT